MRKIVFFLAPMMLAACSSADIRGVKQVDVQKTKTLNLDYDTAWEQTLDWFTGENIPIEKVDKKSGLLASQYLVVGRGEHLNCGTPTGNIGMNSAKFDGVYGNINVVLLDREDGVKITVNLFGSADVILQNGYGVVMSSASTQCYSTGLLEANFLRSMEN